MKLEVLIRQIVLWSLCFGVICIHSLGAEETPNMREITLKTLDIIDVTGSVKDGSGEALIGVNVLVKGSALGTATDFNGEFVLSGVSVDATLVVSYIGYQTQEVAVANQTNIQIVLLEDRQTLDEIVVVGYGEQSRETLTTAVSKLDKKVIENTVFGDAASALQGTVSGVRVETVSGQPGQSPRVIIRGGTSINNPNGAEPLYVVDGVIRDNLNGINTSDIESMQVLKDAASTSIYGARASNGVVIVTLKKGKAGQSVVNYSYSYGLSKLRKQLDVLSAKDFVYYGRLGAVAAADKLPERLSLLSQAGPFGSSNDLSKTTTYTTQYLNDENKHKLDEGWESIPDPIDPSKTLIFENTNWQDVLFRTGITQNHYLDFSGGTEKATFNVGFGYTDIQGVAIYTNYKRLSANLTGRVQINDKVFAYGGLTFSRSGDNSVYDENQLFERAMVMPPTTKYKYEDGTLAPGQSRSFGNPAYHLSRIDADNQENQMTLSGGMNWEILPNLIFEPTASLFYQSSDRSSFQKSYFDSPTQFVDTRGASASYAKWDQQQMDATLSYRNVISGLHNFHAKIGVSYFDRLSRSTNASGRGAATNLIPTLNASAEPSSVNSFSSEQVIFGYFGRVTYDYDRKYLVTVNARYDGASNLGDKNKWGFFPGVSVGWNMHNEDFWTDDSILSSMKVRASYGVNGNLGSLSDFQAQGQYSVGSTYDGVAAVEYSSLANQDLKWEQSKTFDFGFDAGLFNNKIQLIFDYYSRVTDNLITSLTLPNSTGFSSILTNLGSLGNKGVEVELGANIINKNGFTWNLSVNSSYNTNEILKLPENDNENNRIGGLYIYDQSTEDYEWKGGLQEGGKIGELYGYQFVKVFATDEEAAAGPVDEVIRGGDKTKFGGDIDWLDVDNNGVIDTKDKLYMGNIYPKWTGGLSTTLSYEGFSLYTRMDYTVGHTIFNYVRSNMNGYFVSFGINATSDILDSWLNPGDVTDVARYYYNDISINSNYWRGDPRNLNNGNGNSQHYEKGNYLALREVTLSYDIPSEVYSKIGLEKLRLNITGNNLKYFTNYSGLAPEVGGIDRGRYPVPLVVTFGLNASF